MTHRRIGPLVAASGLIVLLAPGPAPAGPPVKPPPPPTPPPPPPLKGRSAATHRDGRWQTKAEVHAGDSWQTYAFAAGWVGIGLGGNLIGWWTRRRGGRAWVAGLTGVGLGGAVGTGLGVGFGPLTAPPGLVFYFGLGVAGVFTLTGGLVAWAAGRRPPDQPAGPPDTSPGPGAA